MGTMDSAPFGKLLREFRLARGLTQESLAELAAMSVNGISALERGANQAPQRKTLELLVGALRLDADRKHALEEAANRPSKPRSDSVGRKLDDLPRPLTPFFGREAAIDAVRGLVDTFSLVTLTGAGGVGKTRLALQVAEHPPKSFRDGVYFVDLAPLRDAESVLWALNARLFDAEALRDKDVLVLLDNCEHLVPAIAPMIASLLSSSPGVHILATSRQPLGVPGERVFRVPSLERESAMELFIERAERAGFSGFSHADRDAMGRIVTHLDGIALAIELAAARMNMLTLDQLEERLSERLHILSGGSTLALPRQQTMRATMDWSYELLDPKEKRIFDCLWIFPKSFSLDAALAICIGDPSQKWQTFEALASLVDKSLVDVTLADEARRYRLLETARAYAAEHGAVDEVDELRRRHAEFYCALAASAAGALTATGSTTAWASSLEPELENFRSTLDWALVDCGDVAAGARLLSDLQEFWIVEGLADEVASRAHKALELEAGLPAELRAALWLTIARMRQELFVHPVPTLEAATNARALYEGTAEQAGLALAIRQQAAAHMRLGAHAQSQEEFEHSLRLYRELGDQRMVARGLGYLASLFQVQGDFSRARTALLDVLQLARSIGDDRMVPTVTMNLAEAEFALGDYTNAAERALENLSNEILQKSCDMLATQEANLAAYLLALGRPEEARCMAFASIDDAGGKFIAVPLQHLAASVAHVHPVCASKILGYVDEAFKATAFSRENTERFTYDYLTSSLSTTVEEEVLAEYRREGSLLNERQVLELARDAAASL